MGRGDFKSGQVGRLSPPHSVYVLLFGGVFQFLFCSVRGVSPPALPGSAARRMVWKWLGALVVFPLQMIYLVAKAAVGLVLPAKLRDLSRENVLITGGGRGIGRQLAREFAERGARKVRGAMRGQRVGAEGERDHASRGAPTCCCCGNPRPGSESRRPLDFSAPLANAELVSFTL